MLLCDSYITLKVLLLIASFSMAGSSDIPDWTFNETGIKYDWKNPTSKTYETMFNMSPIKHIDNVLAPIFLMIGINLQTYHFSVYCPSVTYRR